VTDETAASISNARTVLVEGGQLVNPAVIDFLVRRSPPVNYSQNRKGPHVQAFSE
jgi:hypothetical protein